MEHRLNASKAAKLAGISRRQIQKDIKAGMLNVFEGDVTVKSLMMRYPSMEMHNMKEIKRVARIQQRALSKVSTDFLPADQVVVDQINRMQTKLDDAHMKVADYEELVFEMKDRLIAMKENCDRQQKQTLSALINWMMVQYQQRHG